jgi:glucose-1-phosphate cytidylyltransferase
MVFMSDSPPKAGQATERRCRARRDGTYPSGVTSPADVPVVILCGGMGTRLREETEQVPKPLVAIGGRPIVWHIMKGYAHHGFRRFVLCLGYKGWLLKDYFLRYREQVTDLTVHLGSDGPPTFHGDGPEDWDVTLVDTGLTTGTAGRVRAVNHHLDAPVFMLTYGDGVSNIDLRALLESHEAHRRLATLTSVRPTSRYGEITANGDEVVSFHEKPAAEGLVSGGFFVFQREFVDELPQDPAVMLEEEPMRGLAHRGELRLFHHDGYWGAMDTYRDFLELNRLWDSGSPPWRVWE